MYKVIYKNGDTTFISDSKAYRILLLQKQNMLSIRQREWLKTVDEIVELRQTPNHQLLNKTKDMDCNCIVCKPHLR